MVVAGTAANPVNTGIKGSAVFTLSNMAVEGHTDQGVWMYEFCNTVLLDHISCCGNSGGTGYGLRVGPGGVSFRDNTLFRASNCVFRQNTIGVRIEQAQNFLFDHFVIESNTGVGLSIFRYTALPAGTVPSIDGGGNVGASHGQTRNGWFHTGNFENNGYGDVTGATPQVLITAQVPSFDYIDTPSTMTFENIVMAGYITSALGVWQPNFKITSGQGIRVLKSYLGTKDPVVDGDSLSPTLLEDFSSECTFNDIKGNTVYTDTGSDNCTVNDVQTSIPIVLTGMATNVIGTAFYNVVHKNMVIDLPALAGTSNSLTHTIQLPGLSANLRPPHAKFLVVPMLDSGVWGAGFCEWNGIVPNEIKLWKNSMSSNFASAGMFIFRGGQLPYTIR